MTKSKASKTVQSTKVSIQITRILGGWITAHCSYLDGGRSLAFGTILAFKSEINREYWNTMEYLFVYYYPTLKR